MQVTAWSFSRSPKFRARQAVPPTAAMPQSMRASGAHPAVATRPGCAERMMYLSPEEDAHSERSTLLSPSLSGSGAGEGRQCGAFDTSTSSFNQSDFDDTVEASSGDYAEVQHTQVRKWGRWIPSRISEARLREAATAETAATSTEVHVDIHDADNEDAEGASVDN